VIGGENYRSSALGNLPSSVEREEKHVVSPGGGSQLADGEVRGKQSKGA